MADDAVAAEAKQTLELVGAAPNWDLVRVPTNRSWTRDTGPLFVERDGKKRATHWRFNAWAKYDDWQLDVEVAPAIARAANVECAPVQAKGAPVVLEGGAIDVDGEGTLLATEECLQDRVQCRNPELSTAELEGVLRAELGAERVVWLGKGIAGDDTHGHIDDLARFVAPGLVVLCDERDAGDENYRALAENRERLEGARDAKGRKLDVVALPMPRALAFEGRRLPASYANFYVANDVVLVPTFNDPADRQALGILAELFASREVVGVHCVDLVWGLGTLHCMTQQEPA
ncbi:MAG: agmatine deiminase family protein [Polyangia bacterium]